MKMEQVGKDLQESMFKISGMDYQLAALQKAYEKDPSKKTVLDKIKGYKENLGKMISGLYEADKEPKKLPDTLLSLYREIPNMEKGIKEIEKDMHGDISYKRNKYKRGHFVKNVYKALKAVKGYLQNKLSAGLVDNLDKMYGDQVGAAKQDYSDFKKMVKQYKGDKIYVRV